MPHVVLTGAITPAQAAKVLTSATDKRGDVIMKLQDSYLSTSGGGLLLDGVVVEGGKPHPVLARVDPREDGVVVRLSPLLEIDKTDGVKRFLAWNARRLKEAVEGIQYGATNLQPFLA